MTSLNNIAGAIDILIGSITRLLEFQIAFTPNIITRWKLPGLAEKLRELW